MRINGFDQLKAFYSWVFNNQDKNVKSQHISLYVFLLNQNNRNNWVEWFKCPFDLAMSGSAIGNKKTYYNCLRDLSDWGLIEYKKGINDWKAPSIKLEVLKCTSTATATVPQSVPLLQPLPIPLPTHIYKLITDNLELITNNLENWILSALEQNEQVYRKFKHLSITQGEFDKLNEDWEKESIDTVLDKIENYAKNKSYTSLYLTALNWLKKDNTAKQKKKLPAFIETNITL